MATRLPRALHGRDMAERCSSRRLQSRELSRVSAPWPLHASQCAVASPSSPVPPPVSVANSQRRSRKLARRSASWRGVRDRLEELCKEIKDAGGKDGTKLDVSDTAAIPKALDEIEAALGGPVDCLVNNAGMSIDGPLLDVKQEDFETVMNINTTAPLFIAQAVARRLVAAKQEGSIVNIASLVVHKVGTNIGSYSVSKAAIDQLTRAMAKEWSRYGIRVNALLPGYVLTEINRDFFATDAGAKFIQRLPRRRVLQVDALDGLCFCWRVMRELA